MEPPQITEVEGLRDMRIERVEALAPPADLLAELPMPPASAELVLRGRAETSAVLRGEDDRLLVVVGPCSVHDTAAAGEYAERLAARAGELSGELLVVMRVYFEKPRTTTGWKGLINDPHLDGSGDVNTGLHMARELLLRVLDLGLPAGCEWLDPITPQYIADTVSWGAIGARTTESQIHRQLGSGLSMPVGFKNGTDGGVQVAIDAVRAAAASHSFTGIDPMGTPAILHTSGNADAHVILRGGRDAPNFEPEPVADALARLEAVGLAPRLIVDASHDNSRKDPARQIEVAGSIADQVGAGSRGIVGVMLESFLLEGRQDLSDGELVYGRSITDACIDWPSTSAALDRLAASVRSRRERIS